MRWEWVTGLLSCLSFLVAVGVGIYQWYSQYRILKYEFKENTRKTMREDNLKKLGFKRSFQEQMYDRYWVNSGAEKRLKRIPFWSLGLVSFGCAVSLAYSAMRTYDMALIGVSGFLIGGMLPLELIDVYKAYRAHQVVRELPMLFGVLLRWAHISEDPIYCLGKLGECGLSKQVVAPFTQFCIAYQAGTPLEAAVIQLERQSDLKIMKYFAVCLEQLIRQRGNVIKLFEAFEEEAYQLQQEEIKRKMTRLYYKLLINVLCLSSFFIMHGLLKTNRVLASFYIQNAWGQGLLGVMALVGALIFISGFKYDQSEV